MTRSLRAVFFVAFSFSCLGIAAGAGAAEIEIPTYTRDTSAIAVANAAGNGVPRDFLLVDLDGDGLEDLLYFVGIWDPGNQVNLPHPLYAYRNLGGGDFELVEASTLVGGSLPDIKLIRRFGGADFNGDATPDVYLADSGDDFPGTTGADDRLLLSDAGGGLSDAAASLPAVATDFSRALALGDIDDDGDMDIFAGGLVVGGGGGGAPHLLLNDGAGSFTFDQSRLPALALLGRATSAELLDANGDGHLDLLLGSWQLGFVAGALPIVLFLNDGGGDFSGATPFFLPVGSFGAGDTTVLDFHPIDLDGDGNLDLLVSEANANGNGARVQVLMSNGTGGFRDESARFPTDFPFVDTRFGQFWIYQFETIHFNDDGAPDIYVQLNDIVGKGAVFVNNGHGFFAQVPADTFAGATVPFPGFGAWDGPTLFPVPRSGPGFDFINPEELCLDNTPGYCVDSQVTTPIYRRAGTRNVNLNFAQLAVADLYMVPRHGDLMVPAGEGVLANDEEFDGDSLTAELVTAPAHGDLTLDADGGFTYAPDDSFEETDSFTYRSSDGALPSNLAMVTLTLEPATAMPWLSLLLD